MAGTAACSSTFDQLPDPFALMCPEVVHDHYLSQSQLGSQKVLHVGLEDLLGRGSLKVAIEKDPYLLRS